MGLKMHPQPRLPVRHGVILLAVTIFFGCSQKYEYKDDVMPANIPLSPRLANLLVETKLVCFGRYALTVPKEAELIWGTTSFPSKINSYSGNLSKIEEKVAADIALLKKHDRGVELTYSQAGPIEGSWQLRYFKSKAAKELNLQLFNTYVNKDEWTFILRGGVDVDASQTAEQALAVEAARARSLRARLETDVPSDQGYCIEHGFMANSSFNDQEIVNIGLYLPSLPDVTFSISSNKDAYADYPLEDFEKKKTEELSLLARIRKAKEEQGALYPHRTLLREGKRAVQHWRGEESLIRRNDGVHDFEWAFVGIPKDVANPSEFNARMYTKVAHNTVGAAKSASLSDDEAVALWDKLLSGLKFRVKVPSAPEGSYLIPPDKTNIAATGQ